MTRKRAMTGSLAALVAALFGCALPTRADAQQAIEKRFEQLDTNRDGKLTPNELNRATIFKALDLDANGEITQDEVTQAASRGLLRQLLGGAIEQRGRADDVVPEQPAKPLEVPVRQGPKLLTPGEHGIGRYLTDVSFTDLSGTQRRLHGEPDDQLTVLALTSTSCPLSKKYLPTLVELNREFAHRGVRFILVNAVATDKPTEMATAASQFEPAIAYCVDPDGQLASHISATSTTDIVVLDRSQTIVYHGAIDDQYGLGYARNEPSYTYLRDALAAALTQRPVLVAATSAPGCLLDTLPANIGTAEVTYHDQVARLLQRHCVECHRDGGVGPFALDTYADAIAHAPMIRDVLERGVMPPWFAAEDASQSSSPWINDRSLSASEKQTLFDWLDNQRPAGDPERAPLPREFADGWLIGKPDAVFEFSEPFPVQATGTMDYENITVETHLTQEQWVQAIEIRPGEPSVVHHVLVFVDGSDNSADSRDNAADEQSGYWGIYVPGNSTLVYPAGYAKRIPKGARLRFQMHYTPNGTATADSTRIGLVFAKQPPRHEVHVAGIARTKFNIPAGAANHQVSKEIKVPTDVQVLAFLPHMHLRGKAARFDLLSGDQTHTMLDIPRYDFNWQLLYRYAQPVTVKAGETLRFTAWYDNSADNPANPNPHADIGWGPQTYDEMHLGYVEYIVPGAELNDPAPLSPKSRVREALSGAVERTLGSGLRTAPSDE